MRALQVSELGFARRSNALFSPVRYIIRKARATECTSLAFSVNMSVCQY